MICMDDFICGMVCGCLKEKGIRVPSQMRLASFYDSPQLERNVPPITSVHFDTRQLGRSACGMLLKLLGEEIEEEITLMNYQVVLRESTK